MNVHEEMDQIHTDIIQNHTFPRAINQTTYTSVIFFQGEQWHMDQWRQTW